MGLFALWIICGIIAAIIASQKGSSGCGFAILGFLLGPIGIILSLLLSGEQCPYCRKKISKDITVCPFCKKELKGHNSDPEIGNKV